MRKNQIFTIPNVLATIRLLLVPVVIVLILQDRMMTALIFFLAACFTDVLDGFIARKFDMITQLGKILDPVADKFMAVGVIITFTIRGILPLWVTIVIFVKESMMIAGGIVAHSKIREVIPSNIFGKIAAFVFNTSIAGCFFYKLINPYYRYFVYIALVGSVASLVQYAYLNRGLLKK